MTNSAVHYMDSIYSAYNKETERLVWSRSVFSERDDRYMNTTVYFIRHGTTDNNVGGRFQGSSDIPLGQVGLKQAEYLGERFRTVPLDAVYSSPLTRAKQTAQGVCKYLSLEPIVCNDLREIDGGKLEGRTIEENKQLYPEIMRMFRDDPAKFNPPDGESTAKVHERMVRAVNHLIDENRGKCIAIVSHGFALQTYLACLDTPFEKMEPNIVGNASVTCLVFDEKNNFHTECYNDQSHLPEDIQFHSPFTRVGHAPGK